MVFDAHERAFALFKARVRAWPLLQYEEGGGSDLRRQGLSIQPPLPAAVLVSSGRARRLHAGLGQGERSGREPGRARARALLHASPAVQELRRTERLAFPTSASPGPKPHTHPERPEQTIWEVFEDERPKLIPDYRCRFDRFHAVPASVSKICLARFDNNKYSVSASAVGCPVDIHAYADRLVIGQDERIVAEHERAFGRGERSTTPWHYVPVPARKLGALRNGAPFKDWVLAAALDRIRRRLAGSDDGDQQMVKACPRT